MHNDVLTEFTDAYPALKATAQRVAGRLLLDPNRAEDVAQEALLRAFVRWEQVRNFAPAWVTRVAANVAIGVLRRQREVPASRLPGGVTEASVADRLDLVGALDALSARQREVVVLRHLLDLREEEVAQLLGCSVGSVKRHGSRGRAELRAALSPVTERKTAVTMTAPPNDRPFVAAVEPPDGWLGRPWDHVVADVGGNVVRHAVDDNGNPVRDADGDLIMTGPGFDYEPVKVDLSWRRRDFVLPAIDDSALAAAAAAVLTRAVGVADEHGHPWLGTEHVGIALLEADPALGEVIAPDADAGRLEAAVALNYEGPRWAAARLERITSRRAEPWTPHPTRRRPTPALLDTVAAALEIAAGEGRSAVSPADLARVLGTSVDGGPDSLPLRVLRRVD